MGSITGYNYLRQIEPYLEFFCNLHPEEKVFHDTFAHSFIIQSNQALLKADQAEETRHLPVQQKKARPETRGSLIRK